MMTAQTGEVFKTGGLWGVCVGSIQVEKVSERTRKCRMRQLIIQIRRKCSVSAFCWIYLVYNEQ